MDPLVLYVLTVESCIYVPGVSFYESQDIDFEVIIRVCLPPMSPHRGSVFGEPGVCVCGGGGGANVGSLV